MNGERVKFDSIAIFEREYSFIIYEMEMSQCGGSVHVVMKNQSLEEARI